MNKTTKTVLTVVGVTAAGAGLLYAARQVSFAKNIRVVDVDFNIFGTLFATAYALSNDEGSLNDLLDQGLTFDLTLQNDSNIEIEVKQVDLDVRFDNTLVGQLSSEFNQVIPPNSQSPLLLTLDFVDNLTLIQLGLFAADHMVGDSGVNVTIDGNVKSTASIFETINTKYNITFDSQSLEEIL